MGRVLKPIALSIGVAALAFVTGGVSLATALVFAKVGAIVGGVVGGLSYLSGNRSTLSGFDPRSINPDPAAPRKLVLGRTAMPMDLRYAEPSGTNQEYVDYIFALAAHKSDAVESIYIEEDLAWTSAGGAQGKYAGYLTIEVILEASASTYHTVNAGTIWGSATRMTGCTTIKVRVKRSDNSKTSQSPFGSGIAGRWTTIGRGIPVYDPARDSTVPGGSGSQRVTDQTTWAYTASSVARGNNPALQLLAYLIGWRIGGVVSVGAGLPADVIDMPSFAAAAAICDESVALAAGGTQRRYETGIAFADNDDPLAIINTLLAAMNGELVDDGGRLALRLAVNDLTAAVTLTDDDFVTGYEWRPQPTISEQFTVVRGRFTQPDAPSLFSMGDYPETAIPRISQVPRPLTLELRAVQEQRRAQRIARQVAIRQLYRGQFVVTLGVRAWQLRRNTVVSVTSNARGWNAKLFRVRSIIYNTDATVEVVLQEENAAIYAWSTGDEAALVTPVSPVVFDTRNANSWLMAGIEPTADVTASSTPSIDALPGQVFAADYLGVLNTGQLPRTVKATRRRGGIDVSDTTTWTIATANCTATISSTGLVSITAVTGTGSITVISDRDGVELRTQFDVIVQRAAPPQSGGGGTGGTSASATSFTSILGNSTWTTITSPDLVITIGSNGEAALSAPLEFNVGGTHSVGLNSYGAQLRWQRETSPGTWSTVQTNSETTTCDVEYDSEIGILYSSNGVVTCNATVTGLTASSTQTFRLQGYASTGSTRDTWFFGTAAAVGS